MKRNHPITVITTLAGLLVSIGCLHAAESPARFPQGVASGDPTAGSVILWTRLVDTNQPPGDLTLGVEVATDTAFTSLVTNRSDLLARTNHDGCVKVKVENLDPYTTYYYRFNYQGTNQSRVGRTRTAPQPGAEVEVRFAFLNCQDYLGRYYNSLAHLIQNESNAVDFVVYVGDYIYETTGDASFQTPNASRTISFTDTNGAIQLGSASDPFYAASSLDNYRQLYRTYRSDKPLQDLHALFPTINIWDDHEFSNDNHRDNATYFNGSKSEQDTARKQRAEQVFFEYLPIDVGVDAQGVSIAASNLYPNTLIYRDFEFGTNLHLLCTDFRTYRPDHLVAEDAFPGTVVLDEATTSNFVGVAWAFIRTNFDAYVNIDDPSNAVVKATAQAITTGAYQAAGIGLIEAQSRALTNVVGNLSATYLNALFQGAGQPAPLPNTTSFARGLSYLIIGKQGLFSSTGSRTLVARDTYGLYAAYRALLHPASQDAFGAAQTFWLTNTLAASSSRWPVVASSVSFCPVTFDFANPPVPLPPGFPAALKARLQISADHWDGFPQARQSLLGTLSLYDATVISGDIHASFVSRHPGAAGRVVPEFTGPAAASETFREEVRNTVEADPVYSQLPGIDQLIDATDVLIADAVNKLYPNSLLDLDTASHGYVVMQATASNLTAIYRQLPGANVSLDYTSPSSAALLSALIQESQYVVSAGTNGLKLEAQSQSQSNFVLQVLHASDLEGGVDAIQDAPNFAAVAQFLDESQPNSVILSAGDNYIPGPFFSAAGDPAFRNALKTVNQTYFGVSGTDIREGVGRADATIMNVIGFDASCFGNHEFDPGTPVVREIIGTDIRGPNLNQVRWLGVQFPYLSANLDFSGDPNLASSATTSPSLQNTAFLSWPSNLTAAGAAPKIAPATIIVRGGQTIGVVGGTTPLLAQISSPGDTKVKNPGAGSNNMTNLAEILQPVIDQLVSQGVNKIVLVTHLQQLALERELVPLLRGVDIAIAGGSDSILANTNNLPLRAGDEPVGPYPLFTTNADGDPVVVVSTDGQYKYVGRLVAEFTPAGVLLTNSIAPTVSGAYRTDTNGVAAVWGNLTDPFLPGTRGNLVKQLTDAVQGIVISKDSNIVARTEVFIEGRRNFVRTEETTMGNLSADANLAIARSFDSNTVVSIKNGGGIRAEIGFVDGYTGELLPPQANPLSGKTNGEISQLDIENSLRFNNSLTLLTVDAQELWRLIEHGVAATAPGATPGQFAQVGGMAFTFDPIRTPIAFDTNGTVVVPGQRVRSLSLLSSDGVATLNIVTNGQLAIAASNEFRVVTLNFLANAQTGKPGIGGDGYPFPAYGTGRVDLDKSSLTNTPGVFSFAAPGTEQDAFAEYLRATYNATPYMVAETRAPFDTRIVNLSVSSPWITGIVPVGADMAITFPTVPGGQYSVRYRDSLSDPWQDLPGSSRLGDGLPATVLDNSFLYQPERYYQLVLTY